MSRRKAEKERTPDAALRPPRKFDLLIFGATGYAITERNTTNSDDSFTHIITFSKCACFFPIPVCREFEHGMSL
jgi:hypothetical protein